MGVDLGSRWIGVAVSDSLGALAVPCDLIERCGDPRADHQALVGVVRELGAARMVVGLPRSLSGELGAAATAALAEVEEIKAALVAEALSVPVEVWDERLTTSAVAAGPFGRSGGRGGKRPAKRRRPARGRMDAAAAAMILQSWLDGRR